MIQIIALYQPTGAPWYYVPLNVFLFLIALSFPFVVRFVILRRPVISLWAAIPLSFLFGLIIELFLHNLFPIKLKVSLHTLLIHHNFPLLLFLFGVACIYSYWIMHIGYRSYCIQRLIKNNTEDEPKVKQEIMNWKRGLRRIVFVLALVAAAICAALVVGQVLSIHSEAQSNLKLKQQKYAEQYPFEIPDGFILELDDETVSKLRAVGFSDKEIQDYAENHTANLKAQQIVAKKEILQEEKDFWVNLSILGLGALCGVTVAGTFGFLTVWLIYGLLEWLVLGFCDNNRLKLTIRRLTGLLPFIVPVVMRVFHNCSAMNKKHKIIWIGIAVVVLMCIFPPWIRVIELEGSRAYRSIGYHFLLAPPKSKGIESYSIDLGRLIIQCVIVSLITGGLLYTLRTEQSNRE